MFGKRGNEDGTEGDAGLPPPPHRLWRTAPAPALAAAPRASAFAPAAAAGSAPRRSTRAAISRRSRASCSASAARAYYDTKSQVFSALIDTIDLSQLAKLDTESAREEIRDIVNDIITIKNFAMSISEQEELLEDICNDVLGYGPLEPLLARDDIADIMVNGAEADLHRSRRQDRADRHPLPRQPAAPQHLPAHRQPGRPPRR